MKCFALGLGLKKRLRATRKWAIVDQKEFSYRNPHCLGVDFNWCLP